MDPRGDAWLEKYGEVIDQIACPAYCCTSAGAVVHGNRSARRLWGRAPLPIRDGCWDGFAALYRPDGSPLEKSSSPAALAARTGLAPPPTELVAESSDGQKRCLVVHARPVRGNEGATVGVLCSLTDISERRRLGQEVQCARDSREGFLRVLAHELRNPLASVMAVAAILRRQPGELGIARMARVIERQTRQLARFIDDLLDASRIEQACDIPVAMRAASFRDVMALARDVAEGVLHGRAQTLRVDLGVGESMLDVTLWCDPERLAQALGNALLNASEFSNDGAEVALAVRIDGAFLEISVSDDGIGVEVSELPAMFEPFRKLAGHPLRAPSGAGLGLAIARGICVAHGGMVSAHSAGPGQGTRLKFILPVVQDVQ
ncbi:PAS domain-containing protein [Herbaspirillum sp. SJZ107]|nr:PAS domain-containing protein [Herbaspirillum sp. SJZ107]